MAAHGRSARQGRPQTVVDAIGPVGRCDRHDELDDLLLVKVRPQRRQVHIIDVARPARQQVGEAEDGPLGAIEKSRIPPPSGFAQGRQLLIVVAAPPRRGGVRARSILAAVED